MRALQDMYMSNVGGTAGVGYDALIQTAVTDPVNQTTVNGYVKNVTDSWPKPINSIRHKRYAGSTCSSAWLHTHTPGNQVGRHT